MRQILSSALWMGHAGDARDLNGLLAAGFEAIVDLAINEPPLTVTRELIYCRFPLVDGPGNSRGVLRAAFRTIASLLETRTQTLVFCSAGMSRTPAITAGALALFLNYPPQECLAQITQTGACDVSPGLWEDVVKACLG